ncbi:nitroreductase [Paenibacillus shirakamiensis]|uniref:Nitroreductase n=1 Tax=Paenibacillus shirakamiensis TaxID=1265935 RepID=A0ABS4JJN1_9BACL|nr:nitroreductase family protein [Paenibacillus shirakamiensis]MBP2001912.1 nitroreductase [Paenibacillus shirakamiensis]
MSNPVQFETSDLFTLLEERRSVRAYDPNHRISREELTEILELSSKAPSSSNLQPWRFLVIDDPAIQEQLLPIANNQQQVKDASAIIAVLSDLKSYDKAEAIYGKGVASGHLTEEIKTTMVERIVNMYGSLPKDKLHNINLLDAGLVSMQLMLIAKAKGYDTVPMGGFNAEKFSEFFTLPDTLVPAVLIAVGKAAGPARATARLSVEETTFWNSVN